MNSKEAAPTRTSAAERREAILAVAIQEFARHGLAGSSTEVIAARGGVSQPYLFKLFRTKKALFLAAYERVMTHIDDEMDAAVAAHPADPLGAMEQAYRRLLEDRRLHLMLLQAYAAAADDEVRLYVREREARTLREVADCFEGDLRRARLWLAEGLIQTVGAVLDLPEYIG